MFCTYSSAGAVARALKTNSSNPKPKKLKLNQAVQNQKVQSGLVLTLSSLKRYTFEGVKLLLKCKMRSRWQVLTRYPLWSRMF